MTLEKDDSYMGYISVDLNQKEGLIENLKDFLRKAMDANKKGLNFREFYYVKYIRKPLKIVNGKIKLVRPSTYDEDELDFFDSMPEIFDIGENTRKVKFFMENINYENIRRFDRREEHLNHALTEKIENFVDSGKSQSYIQDFINGFNSIDAERINTPDYEFSIDKKSDAWISGFNFIKSLYFMGDVILDNREYIAESGGINKALEDRYNLNDNFSKGIGIGEQYNQKGRSDNYYKMGEYLLQNENLNGVYFDSLNQSLQSFDNVIKTKKKDQYEFYNHDKINRECSAIQININRYFILLKNIYKVILNLKNTAKDSDSFEEKVLLGKYIEELISAINMLLNSMTSLEERLNLLRNEYDSAQSLFFALNEIKNNQKEIYTKTLDEMKNDAEKKMNEIGSKINEIEKSNIGPKIGLNKILGLFGKQIESKD